MTESGVRPENTKPRSLAAFTRADSSWEERSIKTQSGGSQTRFASLFQAGPMQKHFLLLRLELRPGEDA